MLRTRCSPSRPYVCWPTAAPRLNSERCCRPASSPSPHAALEGIANCSKCHEPGGESPRRSACRVTSPWRTGSPGQAGVHRDVKGDCVSCHVEHTGVDGELRPFDARAFDHAARGAVSARCTARRPGGQVRARATRHGLSHGRAPTVSRATRSAQREAPCRVLVPYHWRGVEGCIAGGRFDHAKSAFPLVGAHKAVTCANCHVNGAYKGLSFCHASCQKIGTSRRSAQSARHATRPMPGRTTKVDHSWSRHSPASGRTPPWRALSARKQSALKAKTHRTWWAARHVDVHRGTFEDPAVGHGNELRQGAVDYG